MSNQPKVKIVACGGAGSNLAEIFSKYYNDKLANVKGLANLDIIHLDTSKANIKENLKLTHGDMDYFIIKEDKVTNKTLSGSGGVRASNIKAIQNNLDEILINVTKNESKDTLYIMLFSLSGGTGSIMGPLVLDRLKRLKKPVTTVTVSDNSSIQYHKNSLKSLATLDGLAVKNKYLSTLFVANNKNKLGANEDVIKAILSNILMFSNNEEIDQSDIKVAYNSEESDIENKVYGLGLVNLITNLEEIKGTPYIIRRYVNDLTTESGVKNLYDTIQLYKEGKFDKGIISTLNPELPFNLVISVNYFADKIKKLATDLKIREEKLKKELENKKDDRLSKILQDTAFKDTVAHDELSDDDDGIVL